MGDVVSLRPRPRVIAHKVAPTAPTPDPPNALVEFEAGDGDVALLVVVASGERIRLRFEIRDLELLLEDARDAITIAREVARGR